MVEFTFEAGRADIGIIQVHVKYHVAVRFGILFPLGTLGAKALRNVTTSLRANEIN